MTKRGYRKFPRRADGKSGSQARVISHQREDGVEAGMQGIVVESQAKKTVWTDARARWIQLKATGAQHVTWGVS